jgi:membrane protein YqaA with SNARE-associated domain
VGELVGALLVSFASALVPLINIEAYLAVRAGVADVERLWLLALVAAVGQMLGKVIWYYLGASALNWPWIRRKLDAPKQAARLATWQRRAEERPALTGFLVFVSAFSGFPPLAIIAVVAGQLRIGLVLFFTVGIAGRWLRFAAFLGGAGWLRHLWLS